MADTSGQSATPKSGDSPNREPNAPNAPHASQDDQDHNGFKESIANFQNHLATAPGQGVVLTNESLQAILSSLTAALQAQQPAKPANSESVKNLPAITPWDGTLGDYDRYVGECNARIAAAPNTYQSDQSRVNLFWVHVGQEWQPMVTDKIKVLKVQLHYPSLLHISADYYIVGSISAR
jgi:hypothetical protein